MVLKRVIKCNQKLLSAFGIIAIILLSLYFTGCCQSPPDERKGNLILGVLNRVDIEVILTAVLSYGNLSNSTEDKPFYSEILHLKNSSEINNTCSIRILSITLKEIKMNLTAEPNNTTAQQIVPMYYKLTFTPEEGTTNYFFYITETAIVKTEKPPQFSM